MFGFTDVSFANSGSDATYNAINFIAFQGKAKVYLVGGSSGFGSFMDPVIPGAELIVNDLSVVKLGKNEVGVIDVRPGEYRFSWKDIHNEGKPEVLSRRLKEGEILILRADFKMGGAALIFGPVAASATNKITETLDRGVIRGKTIVVASGCPQSICGSEAKEEKPSSSKDLQQSSEPVPIKPTERNSTPNLNLPNTQALESKCQQLGFTVGTEKYGDCVMRLLK
jgi:hypothetical protein